MWLEAAYHDSERPSAPRFPAREREMAQAKGWKGRGSKGKGLTRIAGANTKGLKGPKGDCERVTTTS
ncbi:hypothetical protein BJB45_08235 [Halomonas huangheensis]|uniref:Uncharacterized protein n=1 Tax=Halomonas huangheensis TaxID=1178482 RepID=W1NBE3_9GAMM|nr:hypothetical protein AR456_18715 [Halomonas huangheensis]ERL52531.1 hypothetical protein BJB45_08235 [Halomonas huangheensis]